MSKKIGFLFPGQGAQYVGMGKEFYEAFPIARQTFEEANDLLGRDLSSIILEGPEKTLTETRNSQTGIFVTSIALLRVVNSLFPTIQPAACAGLSLGEYTALSASNRLSFSHCLPLVQNRGQFMNDACEAIQGTMAVVLGLEANAVEEMVKEVNMPNDLWAANFNCPGQIVISGTLKGIEAGTVAAKAKGAKRVLPLSVHGAFHSGLMKQAKDLLAEHINEVTLSESSIDLVMNVPGDFVKDASLIKKNLIQQVTSPVRWEQGIKAMNAAGIDLFIEIGCGTALTNFNKRIQVSGQTFSIEKIADLKELEKLQ